MPAHFKPGRTNAESSIDVNELLRLLQRDPKTRRAVNIVIGLKEVADALSFPIDSHADLIRQIGDQGVVVRGLSVPQRVINLIPKYYFPIASKDNFVEKGEEFFRHLHEGRLSPTLPMPPPRAVAEFRIGPPPMMKKTTLPANER